MRQIQPGDMVRFSDDGYWVPQLAGKIGLMTDVRPNPTAMSRFSVRFDAVVDGKLTTDFNYEGRDSLDDCVEVISGEDNGEG